MGERISEETIMLADEVELLMKVEFYDGDPCDTEVKIDGVFYVEGSRRKEFSQKMQALVNEYII